LEYDTIIEFCDPITVDVHSSMLCPSSRRRQHLNDERIEKERYELDNGAGPFETQHGGRRCL
jgi:hypothetical protein